MRKSFSVALKIMPCPLSKSSRTVLYAFALSKFISMTKSTEFSLSSGSVFIFLQSQSTSSFREWKKSK